MDVFWIDLSFILIVALIITSLTGTIFGVFFWLLILGLLIAVALRYYVMSDIHRVHTLPPP